MTHSRESKSGSLRPRVVDAYARLVLDRKNPRPQIRDIIGAAGIGRSTFYEHFDSKDAVLIESMRRPLTAMAQSLTGKAPARVLADILAHFHEHRRHALALLTGPIAPRLTRTLAGALAQELPKAEKADTLRLAEMQLGFMRLWLSGETPSSPEKLGSQMIKSTSAYCDAHMLDRR